MQLERCFVMKYNIYNIRMWLKRPLNFQIRQRHAAYDTQRGGETLENNLNVMLQRWGIRGVTGKLGRAASPHYSCLTFTFPVLVMQKREKISKNTNTILQTASSARISPSQDIMLHWLRLMRCMIEISHNAVQCRAHPGPRWKDHTFRRLLILLADSFMLLLLHPPSSSPAGSAVKFSPQSADTELWFSSWQVSGSPGF